MSDAQVQQSGGRSLTRRMLLVAGGLVVPVVAATLVWSAAFGGPTEPAAPDGGGEVASAPADGGTALPDYCACEAGDPPPGLLD